MIDILTTICNKIWKTGEWPTTWTQSLVIRLPMKGNLQLCKNYRTISLISHPSKVMLKIILNRLQPQAEEIIAEEQAGFRAGRSTTRVSTRTNPLNIFLEIMMCEALDDHEGSISIGGRLIINFRFADDIVVNAEEGEEAGVLIDRLDRTTTRYKMEIGPDKTKVMKNNPNGVQREIKIKGQRLEEVENFKYLGAIISNEDSFQDSPDNRNSF